MGLASFNRHRRAEIKRKVESSEQHPVEENQEKKKRTYRKRVK